MLVVFKFIGVVCCVILWRGFVWFDDDVVFEYMCVCFGVNVLLMMFS